ncbi:hypothetical protein [Roseovarius aestuarii]|nr:hypothetical protein [Roseovarius aestuarii]
MTAMVMSLLVVPGLLGLSEEQVWIVASAAYAKDGNSGGGNSGSGSGNSGSDNSGSDNSGKGSSNSGKGSSNSGRGKGRGSYSGNNYSGKGGGDAAGRQAAPDIIVRHLNGWVEEILAGIYVVRDAKNRTVIRRSATPTDIMRMNGANNR